MTNDLQFQLESLQSILYSLPGLSHVVPVIDDCDSPRSRGVVPGYIPVRGVAQLEESIKKEIAVIERRLKDPPPKQTTLSTNAPYFISLWNVILSAPPPVVSIGTSFALPNSHVVVRVDIVADGGRRWIRINSTKTSRLLAELNELADSDESEASDDDDHKPCPLLLKLVRELQSAAESNSCSSNPKVIPQITLLLTRLSPTNSINDHRITRFLDCLQQTGVDIQFGQSLGSHNHNVLLTELDDDCLYPTDDIALDCSMLVALTSDITHATLPTSRSEQLSRFRDTEQRESDSSPDNQTETLDETHVNALNSQLEHEMTRPLLKLILERLESRPSSTSVKVRFFTTRESLSHLLSVLTKVGGSRERRRAHALVNGDADEFWEGSRYPPAIMPFPPLHIYHITDQGKDKNPWGMTVHTASLIQTAIRHGHTIITSNKKSAATVLRSLPDDVLQSSWKGKTLFWLVQPRSLAECARAAHAFYEA